MSAPRISMVTLGVADLPRARSFYVEGLGFKLSPSSNDNVVFIEAGGVVLGLYSREALAEDAQLDEKGSGFGGITIARNVGSEDEVDVALAVAKRAGAKILKPAQKVFWGGYSGYFADLDGHPWEVAFNPHWRLDANGAVVLP